ncbi:hypothetical protein LOTGIDRAFT_153019 [Lottia gigantea]|uniref:Retrotransposon gag domain-containing protein n=1 Tax=Lottia gigantea TaxID=225164 RepID=V4AWL5_LOTGI|nr:hypothetical protein LOTGIDRAFT_153019 [Lottia gigantea]ESO97911.1 hypothetical protein LOTGIDRAFT_153019 [Lottia gigantea]
MNSLVQTIRSWDHNHQPKFEQKSWSICDETQTDTLAAPQATFNPNTIPGYSGSQTRPSDQNGLLTRSDVPHLKLPTLDGSGEWDAFTLPFTRAANRNECTRGAAAKFITTLPQEIIGDYNQLMKHMQSQFGRKNPPSTARKKLSELRQKAESNDEFAEEVIDA